VLGSEDVHVFSVLRGTFVILHRNRQPWGEAIAEHLRDLNYTSCEPEDIVAVIAPLDDAWEATKALFFARRLNVDVDLLSDDLLAFLEEVRRVRG